MAVQSGPWLRLSFLHWSEVATWVAALDHGRGGTGLNSLGWLGGRGSSAVFSIRSYFILTDKCPT